MSRPRLAAVVDTQQHHRPIVMVLGMHRSGTSLCSNVLSVLGVDMADDVGIGHGNARGHWERWEIVGFHDRILEHFNRRYFGPFHDFPLPPGWWAEPQIVAIRRELTAFLKDRMGDQLFGFKDPRTVRLLPLWRDIFAQLGLSPRIVLCLRKPAEIARSLYARDGIDPCIGEYRWLIHLSDFFRYAGKVEYCTIEYDSWFDNISANIEKLQKHLHTEGAQTGPTLDQALQEIIDPMLRHEASVGPAANEPIVRQFYELVLAAEHDDAAQGEIHKLIAQLDGWTRLQRGFYRAYETVSATAERVPELESEITNLQAAVTRDTENLARAQDEIAAQQARLAEVEAEREAVEARVTGLEADLAQARDEIAAHQARMAELAAECEAINARAGAAEAELAQAQDEAAAQLAESEAERAILRRELEQRGRDHAEALAGMEQQVAEAAAAKGALQGEVAALGEQLSRARDRLSRAEATGAEVSRKLAQAEAQVRLTTDEAASARHETATLRTQLEAAREVGARLVAAFRSDLSAAAQPQPVVRRSWWKRRPLSLVLSPSPR